jgi:predicted house-cleaning noncanonical NTP pyrophosphatase (MazG superfamily)
MIHRFKVDKLIRDKQPEIMRASGIQVFERPMEKEEYLQRLKDKLLEEAKEVAATVCEKELREELADVFEVMLSLLEVYGMELADIQQTAEQKKRVRGGFDDRIYNAFVEMEEGNPALSYYRDRPDQYPEVK